MYSFLNYFDRTYNPYTFHIFFSLLIISIQKLIFDSISFRSFIQLFLVLITHLLSYKMFIFFDFYNKIQHTIYNRLLFLKFFILFNLILLIIKYFFLINFQILYFLFYLVFIPSKILNNP